MRLREVSIGRILRILGVTSDPPTIEQLLKRFPESQHQEVEEILGKMLERGMVTLQDGVLWSPDGKVLVHLETRETPMSRKEVLAQHGWNRFDCNCALGRLLGAELIALDADERFFSIRTEAHLLPESRVG